MNKLLQGDHSAFFINMICLQGQNQSGGAGSGAGDKKGDKVAFIIIENQS